MRPSNALQDSDLAVVVILFIVALVSGVAGFTLVARADHDACVARYGERTAERIRELCGVRP